MLNKELEQLAIDLASFENPPLEYAVEAIKRDIIYLREMHKSFKQDKKIVRKFNTDCVFTYKVRLKLATLHNLNRKRIYKLLKN